NKQSNDAPDMAPSTKQIDDTSDMTPSTIHTHLSGRLLQARGPMSIARDAQLTWDALEGVGVQVGRLGRYASAMDGQLVGPAAGSESDVPAAFLETWMPGVI